jgi:polyhydroxybutyrate depolymerase
LGSVAPGMPTPTRASPFHGSFQGAKTRASCELRWQNTRIVFHEDAEDLPAPPSFIAAPVRSDYPDGMLSPVATRALITSLGCLALIGACGAPGTPGGGAGGADEATGLGGDSNATAGGSPSAAGSSSGGSDAHLAGSPSLGGTGGSAGGGSSYQPTPSPGCAESAGWPAGTIASSLDAGGLSRLFRMHVPAGLPDGPVPLVLMLHGGGGNAEQFEETSSRMDAVADEFGFVTVYPEGTGLLPTWNGGGCCGAAVRDEVDDVGFISSLLDSLEAAYCFDTRAVFVAGMSNGGIMTHRLACELSNRLAAAASVAGANMAPTCDIERPMPVLEIHGTEDRHVPWEGGSDCSLANVEFPPVADTLEGWRARNHCTAAIKPTFSQGNGSCEQFIGCDPGSDVSLCTIEGGGHSWPGGDPPSDAVDCPADGAQSMTFDASRAIWNYFAAHKR